MQDAVDFQEAGNFDAALKRARTAWLLISTMPDSEFANEKMTWGRESIQNVVEHLQQLAAMTNSSGQGAMFHTTDTLYERG